MDITQMFHLTLYPVQTQCDDCDCTLSVIVVGFIDGHIQSHKVRKEGALVQCFALIISTCGKVISHRYVEPRNAFTFIAKDDWGGHFSLCTSSNMLLSFPFNCSSMSICSWIIFTSLGKENISYIHSFSVNGKIDLWSILQCVTLETFHENARQILQQLCPYKHRIAKD